jgi:phosphate transport system protein
MTDHTASAESAREYEQELNGIRGSLLRMAGRVEQMIGEAGRALVQRDVDLALATIADDREVDRAELDIDEGCLHLLARRQSTVSDLRFVTLAMKMVTDLERIADLAVNICERAVDLAAAPVVVHPQIPEMTARVERMVRAAIDAFVQRDAAKAHEVIRGDALLDADYHVVFQDLLEQMQTDPAHLHEWIHVQSVAKWLERMGDHSVNLAEMVIFLLEGRDIRHSRSYDARRGPEI